MYGSRERPMEGGRQQRRRGGEGEELQKHFWYPRPQPTTRALSLKTWMEEQVAVIVHVCCAFIGPS